ncbi:MAG: molybdopterin-dependent oxidoreductase [Candidatus Caldarchaeum sp.]
MSHVLDKLPKFPTPYQPSRESLLRVCGLVARKLELSISDVKKLPRTSLTFDFNCVEGWAVPQTEWQGVKVGTVLKTAEPYPEARYAVFKSGNYTECFPLSDTDDMLIAYMYRGRMLEVEHGGPFRLVFPNQACYQSIKWLSEIELTTDYVEGTAKKIALARIK